MTLGVVTTVFRKKIPETLHIGWLNIMLWGGVVMLAIEHIAHEEVILYPPFLTAMQTPAQIPVMLQEMATIGGSMTIAIVCIWAAIVLLTQKKAQHIKKPVKP
jgi:hypothetical protein